MISSRIRYSRIWGRAGALVLLLLAACSEATQGPNASMKVAAKLPAEQAIAPAVPPSLRMIIRTATLSLVVDNAAEYLSRVVALVEREGGYIADTRQWLVDNQLQATATFRIPADKLTPAIQEIKKDAIRVSNENVTGQDVSEEYTDLGAQLVNLRATEAELRQLLTTVRERTQKASEVLEVYKEVSKVRGDIDRLQGRVDYLKQMTAMSTINVELIPDQLSGPIGEPGWRPLAIVWNAAQSLVAALKGLAAVLIWLIVFILPLCVLFGLFALGVKRLAKLTRRWRSRQPAPPAA